jgi:hypothetical protein
MLRWFGVTIITANVIIVLSVPAHAIDARTKFFVKSATTFFAVTVLICTDDYYPLTERWKAQSEAYLAGDAERVQKAIGAEFNRFAFQRGLTTKEPNLSELDPEISAVVEETMSGFLKAYDMDAKGACRTFGEIAVEGGFAARMH